MGGRRAAEGNNDATNEITRAAGRSKLSKYRTDLVRGCQVGMWGQDVAGCGEITILRAVQRVGVGGSVQRVKNIGR